MRLYTINQGQVCGRGVGAGGGGKEDTLDVCSQCWSQGSWQHRQDRRLSSEEKERGGGGGDVFYGKKFKLKNSRVNFAPFILYYLQK